MAVDYTKVFTILGVYADKIRDYYAYIATFSTDKVAIDTILAAQSVVYLGDGLTDDYDGFKQSVSDWEGVLINRMENVLTDETLIGANFPFGSRPSIDEAMLALIHDMTLNDKNVVASVATVGSVSYVAENTLHGTLKIANTLDGYSAPMDGAIACPDYFGLTTQLTPDSETITLTCISDSENGGTRGSEVFAVTGTGAGSGPYSPNGESIGTLSNITVSDNDATAYVTNSHFDTWDSTTESLTGWDIVSGTPGDTFLEESATTLYSSGSSLSIVGTSGGADITLHQTLDSNSFNRLRAYWLSVWARKKTDVDGDQSISVLIKDDEGDFGSLNVTATTTTWTLYSNLFLIPAEVTGDIILEIQTLSMDSDNSDPVLLDQLVITPTRYYAGVAMAIFGGPEKWLVGDTATFTLSNNSAGKFQSVFRKALRVQLPTDATPTISDSLVA